jgi:hypothetical protein
MAKVRGERTMHGRIVKRRSLIDMLKPFGRLAQTEQGCAQQAMPDHNKRCGLLLLGEFKESARQHARRLAIEGDELRDEESVEDGVEHQRVFEVLAQGLRALNHRAGMIERRFCFDRRKALRMIQSIRKSDLEFDLLAPQGRSAG